MPDDDVQSAKADKTNASALNDEVMAYLREDSSSIQNDIMLHTLWVNGKGGRKAEFDFKDLSGVNLEGASLCSASFAGTNLAGAILRGADLSSASLLGADLEGADCSDANLTGVDLRGANLHKATLSGAILRGADLRSGSEAGDGSDPGSLGTGTTIVTEAHLERAILCQAKLVGCDFSGADLMEADLGGADLSGAVLIGVDLFGANLEGAALTGAVIDLAALDATSVATIANIGGVVEPEYRSISAEDFVRSILDHQAWVESGGKEGTRIDFDAVRIPNVKMTGKNLAAARMRKCWIDGGDWQGIDLSMSDLSYSNMAGINLSSGNLRGANLRKVNLTGANLTEAVFDPFPLGNRQWPANLEGVILRESNLTKASFNGAILRRADIADCVTDGISIRGADLEGARR